VDWSNYRYLSIAATVALAADISVNAVGVDGDGFPFVCAYHWIVTDAQAGLPSLWRIDLHWPDSGVPSRMYDVQTLELGGLTEGQDLLITDLSLVECNPATELAEPASWPRLKVVYPDWALGDPADWQSISSLVDGVLGFDQVWPAIVQLGQERGLIHIWGDPILLDLIERTLTDAVADINGREGFSATLDAAATDAALEDADANRLYWRDYWCLLRETMDARMSESGGVWSGSLQACPKARRVTLAGCSHYVARPLKIIRGAVHGLAVEPGRMMGAGAGAEVEILRQPADTLVGTAIADVWSYFHFDPLYEMVTYKLHDGGLDLSAGLTTNFGITNTEWTWVECEYTTQGHRIAVIRDKNGKAYIYLSSGGAITRHVSEDDATSAFKNLVCLGENASAWSLMKHSPQHELLFDRKAGGSWDIFTKTGNVFGEEWLAEVLHVAVGQNRVVGAEWCPSMGLAKCVLVAASGATCWHVEVRRMADGTQFTFGIPATMTADFAGLMPRAGSGHLRSLLGEFVMFYTTGAAQVYVCRSLLGAQSFRDFALIGAGRHVGATWLPECGMGVVMVREASGNCVVHLVQRKADGTFSSAEIGNVPAVTAAGPQPFGDMYQTPSGMLVLVFADALAQVRMAQSLDWGRNWTVTS
jgi:hypothetical protein